MNEVGAPRQRSAPQPEAELSSEEVRTLGASLTRAVRGYEPGAVDDLLARVADRIGRLEEHNAALNERVNDLAKKVFFHEGRSWAVQEALVTAETLRSETRDQASAEADRIRGLAAREARMLLTAAREEHGRLESEVVGLRAAAEEHSAATQGEADAYAEAKKARADAAAARTRDRATATAASVLERSEAWAGERRRHVEAELEAWQEESLRLAKERRDAAIQEVRMLRDRAKRDTQKQRRGATAAVEQADADARLIREDVRREVEELRARTERESHSLRALAIADASRIREMAEDAASELEESTRIELLRISTKLQIQIEERHRILDRLDERRSVLLASMQALLVKELEVVERETELAAVGRDEALAAAEDHGAVVIGMALGEAAAPAPPSWPDAKSKEAGLAAGWSTVIDPGTGQAMDAGHGIPLGLKPSADTPPSKGSIANGEPPGDGVVEATPPASPKDDVRPEGSGDAV